MLNKEEERARVHEDRRRKREEKVSDATATAMRGLTTSELCKRH